MKLFGEESTCNARDAGDVGSVPEWGRSSCGGWCMATHSSTLVWRIPWTEEPVGLQSMGLQRVGHNLSDLGSYSMEINIKSI